MAVGLFADAGPGPLIIPILGGLGIAAVFFAVAVVVGGFWLVRGSAAPRARRIFLTITAWLGLAASLVLGFMAETQPEYAVLGAVLALMSLAAFIVLFRSSPARTVQSGNPTI